ncbi:hypothetical protein SJAV_06290 [Sulfurisphaera javensis]|uniref:LPXTG cell wall anchor domain-containing protein n=1 Tax=Sulfurisphaera javensis TaxID=2049879 RepID=A0AAT9GP63_9CREN
MIFSLVTNSYTLKLIINGPVTVIFSNSTTTFLITNSTIVNFNNSVKITVFSSNPSYYIVVNGSKYYNEFTENINKSEILEIKALPEFIKIQINLNGTGNLRISLNNGSFLVINKSTSFFVLNNSIVYINSVKTIDINGIKTNFYVFVVSSNETLNISFVKENNSAMSPKISSQGFLGIGLGLIGLSLYIFFRRRQQ